MTTSPLDELRIDADKVWDKVAPGYILTDEDIAAMVRAERAMRETWIAKSSKKSVEREERKDAKKSAKKDAEAK